MQKVYTTRRLSIRRLTLSDYKAWVSAQDKALPKQDKFDISPRPPLQRSRSFFKKNVVRHAKWAKEDRIYIWNIFLKKTGELVGWIDVSTISRDPHQMANLGYFIINSYRRQGYAREAIRRIIQAAFKDLKFHRLEAVTDLNNRPAIALAKACGMQKEGIKKHYWFQNGRWEDQMVLIATPEIFR